MAHLHIFHHIFRLLQRNVQAADAIARVAVDAFKSPLRKPMPNEFADIFGHDFSNRRMVARLTHQSNFQYSKTLHFPVRRSLSTSGFAPKDYG